MQARGDKRPAKRRKKPSPLARAVMMASILAVVGISSAFILMKPKGRAVPSPEPVVLDTVPAAERAAPRHGRGPASAVPRSPPREGEARARASKRLGPRSNRPPPDEVRPDRPRKLGGPVYTWRDRIEAVHRGDLPRPTFPTEALERKGPKRKYENDELEGQPPMLMVFSHPPGARLKVNGHIWGITPLVRAVGRDLVRLEIELSSPGYRTKSQSLTPDEKGRFQLGVVMEPVGE